MIFQKFLSCFDFIGAVIADTKVAIASYANVSVKIKVEEAEGEEEEYDKGQNCVNSDVQRHDSGNIIAERHSRKILGPFRKRLARNVRGKPLLSIHRARLSSLLMKLTKMHSWKEASGVVSILLKGTPRGYSLIDDDRSFLVCHANFFFLLEFSMFLKYQFIACYFILLL